MNSKASSMRLAVLLALLTLFGALPNTARAQGRINDYVVEQFDGGTKWDWSKSYTYLGWTDNTYYSVALPFAFNYDGQTVAASSTVRVSTNGWIQFTLPGYSPTASTTTFNGLGSSTYRNMICLFGANMYPSGGIYHQTLGSSPNRTWTISYASTRYQASSLYPYISMELTLYEKDGTIEFRYSTPNLYMGSTAVNAGVGLNGHIVPNFQYRALEGSTSVDYTPAHNWRVRPPRAAVPQLAVSVSDVQFDPALVGAAAQTACVTVTNVGTNGEPGAANTPLTFTGTKLNGTNDFTLTSNPTQSLAAGESKDYCVSFTPWSMGELSAGLDIKTNGKDSGTKLVAIKAFGLAGRMDVPIDQCFRKTKTKVGHVNAQIIPVMNTGNHPMTIISAVPTGDYADQYTVLKVPDAPIAAGETDTIAVQYNPIYEGLKTAELVITSDAAFNPTDVVRLYGTGIVPRLAVTLSKVGIDSVRMGDTAYYTINLANVGSDTLAIRRNYFSSADKDFFYKGLAGIDTVIQPEHSAEVVVGFAPQFRGTRQARLRLLTNIPMTFDSQPRDTSEFNIDFTSVGVPSGQLYVEGPTSIDSAIVGKELCQTVTLYNEGEEPLTVTSATLAGADASDFTINGVTFPLTIAAKSNVQAEVCATPSVRGLRNASINVSANTANKTITSELPIAIYGLLACAQPSTVVAFEDQIVHVGETATAQILVNNCGDVPTTYNAVVTGTGYTLTSAATSGLIEAGGNYTFDIAFNPSVMAAMPGTLTVTGENIDDMVISLAGIGGDVMIAAANNTAPETAVGATSDEFTVTVTNNGNMDLTPGEPLISNNEFAYVAGSGPATIAAGEGGTFRFTFAPAGGGARSANVTFPSATPLLSGGFMLNGNGLTADVRNFATAGYSLEQNSPNPAVGSSVIAFTMPQAGHARIMLSDVTGKTVMIVADRFFNAGANEVTLDASKLASGTYFYELVTAEGIRLQRSMLINR